MSVQAITGGAGAQQAAPAKAAQPKPLVHTDAKPQPVAPDTVQISKAGQNALQSAVQEATETATQTAQEAAKGDAQAQRLLARENAAHAAEQPAASEGAEKAVNAKV